MYQILIRLLTILLIILQTLFKSKSVICCWRTYLSGNSCRFFK